mmetsp:Transcript_387/g.625  ORF Transcript_387/g.625 Transcript_387/m.625 type:complete len:366 (-) Transcript_387:566-1663(-)
MSVSDFMKAAMTHPDHGYYMRRDVFGPQGDFVTAPEISQMFGELIGVWCVVMWQQAGRPKVFRLVELGPGRGTLISDLLRATRQFRDFYASLSVHLVDASPALRNIQRSLLCPSPSPSASRTATAASILAFALSLLFAVSVIHYEQAYIRVPHQRWETPANVLHLSKLQPKQCLIPPQQPINNAIYGKNSGLDLVKAKGVAQCFVVVEAYVPRIQLAIKYSTRLLLLHMCSLPPNQPISLLFCSRPEPTGKFMEKSVHSFGVVEHAIALGQFSITARLLQYPSHLVSKAKDFCSDGAVLVCTAVLKRHLHLAARGLHTAALHHRKEVHILQCQAEPIPLLPLLQKAVWQAKELLFAELQRCAVFY